MAFVPVTNLEIPAFACAPIVATTLPLYERVIVIPAVFNSSAMSINVSRVPLTVLKTLEGSFAVSVPSIFLLPFRTLAMMAFIIFLFFALTSIFLFTALISMFSWLIVLLFLIQTFALSLLSFASFVRL
jgi:hypothetical protein